MAYKAGDLSMYIEGISDDTLKSLDAVIERLNIINGGLGKIKGSGARTPKGTGNFGKTLKLGSTLFLARRLGNRIENLIQAGSDYTETLNLWQVAMRGNLDLADQFVTKMNKAYGISSKTLMNAQAIFKNMIGSLGQISDATAYALSEALVQMSADFSSLYNVSLESAFQKMQAMLAGQVRPIRSIGGLDITESTLFMFYQQLGGTKTMRQLTRTEKQLLSILAVYKQMGSAGALGDMTKTLNQFANQARMMTEYWVELKTWTGLILKDLVDQSGALVYINATLITMTEIMKAIATSRGIGNENFIEGMFETTEATNEAVDELKGKLLDFDKFRSLSGNEENVLGIDEKLLEAISGYSSKISEAQNEAAKLAETWTKWWISEDGGLTTQAKIFLEVLELIGATLAVLVGATMISSFGRLSKLLNLTFATTGLLVIGFGTLLYGVINFISAWDDMSGIQRAIGILAALAGAITAVAVAFHATHNWAKAIGIGALVAGAALGVTAAIKVNDFADGGLPDKGTVFRAGEAGAEIVYNTPSGQSGVANVQQISQAMRIGTLQAVKEWWSQAKNDIPQFREVSKTGIYEVAKSEMKRRGEW